jgi:hypothetical protein
MGDALESIGPDAVEDDFHDHYDAHYATSDFEYVQYQPAYQFGYDAAGEKHFSENNWEQAQKQVQSGWDKTHSDSPWELFRDAIHYGWDLRRGMQR